MPPRVERTGDNHDGAFESMDLIFKAGSCSHGCKGADILRVIPVTKSACSERTPPPMVVDSQGQPQRIELQPVESTGSEDFSRPQFLAAGLGLVLPALLVGKDKKNGHDFN